MLCITLATLAACGGAPERDDRSGAGVVAAASPEAAEAGAAILRAGGNAVDAAVAVSLALGVTEPAGSGLFGQTVVLLQRPGEAPVVIDGTTYAPGQLPAHPERAGLTGRRASTVPSTVKVLAVAWRRFGSGALGWAELVEPAAVLAEGGWLSDGFRHASLVRYRERFADDPAAAGMLLDADGSIPAGGSRLTSPLVARTLRRLAAAGPDDFYRGAIAREIAADMAAGGGWITLADLEAFPEPRLLPALRGTYRGWDVHTLPPPFGGWVVLAALHALDAVPAAELAEDAAGRAVALAGALRFAHTMRRDEEVPDMRDYESAVAARTDRERARAYMARAGLSGGGETTHFTVVDGDGMIVAVSQSINNYYGAGVAHPELGILYNDYMAEFRPGDPDHPFGLRPGAMPLSSMSATILARDGAPALALGGPGSARIISSVTQVISRWVDGGLTLDAAVASPRLHVVPADEGDLLYLEGATWPAADERRLADTGLLRTEPPAGLAGTGRGGPGLDPYFGGIHAVGRERGGWVGAADPRRDGAVARSTPRPR